MGDSNEAGMPPIRAPRRPKRKRQNLLRVEVVGGFGTTSTVSGRKAHPSDLLTPEERLQQLLRAVGELVLHLQDRDRAADVPSERKCMGEAWPSK